MEWNVSSVSPSSGGEWPKRLANSQICNLGYLFFIHPTGFALKRVVMR